MSGVLEEKPEGKQLHGRHRYGWGIILKWIFKKYDWMVWTGLVAQDSGKLWVFVNVVMNLRAP